MEKVCGGAVDCCKRQNGCDGRCVLTRTLRRFHTHPVAFVENIQVLCGLPKLVVIQGTLIDGVFAVGLWTVTTIEAFLSQSLHVHTKRKGDLIYTTGCKYIVEVYDMM